MDSNVMLLAPLFAMRDQILQHGAITLKQFRNSVGLSWWRGALRLPCRGDLSRRSPAEMRCRGSRLLANTFGVPAAFRFSKSACRKELQSPYRQNEMSKVKGVLPKCSLCHVESRGPGKTSLTVRNS
jgi:hypothetical protein